MSKVGRLRPLAEYKKPTLVIKDEDRWIIDRLNDRIKESERKIQELNSKLHEQWYPRKVFASIVRDIKAERSNIEKYNDLIRQEKAMMYEEQLKSMGLR